MSNDMYVNSSYGLSEGDVFGMVFAIFGIIFLIALVIGLMCCIGQWKIFKKAGKPGWAALVPFYNMYVMCELSGVNPWWVLIAAVSPTVLNFIPVIGSIASVAISIYYMVLVYVSVAKSFGKDNAYAMGLIFLNPIFLLMLGCGKSEYQGAKPMNDVIMNFFTGLGNNNKGNNSNNMNNSNMNNNYQNNMNNNNMNNSNGFNNNYQNNMNNSSMGNNNYNDYNNMNNNGNNNYNNGNSNYNNGNNNSNNNGPKYCPACGQVNSNNSKFCVGCGRQI